MSIFRVPPWLTVGRIAQGVVTLTFCIIGILTAAVAVSSVPWQVDVGYFGLIVWITAILVGPVAALSVRKLVRQRISAGEKLENEYLYGPANVAGNSDVINALVRSLRLRATRLRFQAQLVLLLILGTLGAGIYVFAAAEKLSRSPLSDLENHLDESSARVATAARALRGSAGFEPVDLGGDATIMMYQLEENTAAMKSLREIITSRADNFTTSTMISTISTRVGIVLMILFLVQILVTMYRYNSRLAAHLDGRSVALQLAALQEGQPWLIAELVNLFGSDSVDFGKLPPTAIQAFADVLKQAAASARRQPAP